MSADLGEAAAIIIIRTNASAPLGAIKSSCSAFKCKAVHTKMRRRRERCPLPTTGMEWGPRLGVVFSDGPRCEGGQGPGPASGVNRGPHATPTHMALDLGEVAVFGPWRESLRLLDETRRSHGGGGERSMTWQPGWTSALPHPRWATGQTTPPAWGLVRQSKMLMTQRKPCSGETCSNLPNSLPIHPLLSQMFASHRGKGGRAWNVCLRQSRLHQSHA